MRARRRTWEGGQTTRYRQWNHTCTRSADSQQRTTNNIALPSRQVSSLISNYVFNTDAPANGDIRLNSRFLIKKSGPFSYKKSTSTWLPKKTRYSECFRNADRAPRSSTYIWVYDEPEHLPYLVLVSGGLHVWMRYVGIPGFNAPTRRI